MKREKKKTEGTQTGVRRVAFKWWWSMELEGFSSGKDGEKLTSLSRHY